METKNKLNIQTNKMNENEKRKSTEIIKIDFNETYHFKNTLPSLFLFALYFIQDFERFFFEQIEKVLKHFIIQGGQKSKRNKREKTIQINILSNYTQLQANSSTGGTTSDS